MSIANRIVNVERLASDGSVDPAGPIDIVSLSEVRSYLSILVGDTSQDAFLSFAITAATEAAEGFCRRPFVKRKVTETIFDNPPTGALVSSYHPIVALTSLANDDQTVDPADYIVEMATGIVRLTTDVAYDGVTHPLGAFPWVLTYTAGWVTASVPSAVRLAILEFVKTMSLAKSRDPDVAMERVDDVGQRTFTWGVFTGNSSNGTPPLPRTVEALLRPFVRFA